MRWALGRGLGRWSSSGTGSKNPRIGSRSKSRGVRGFRRLEQTPRFDSSRRHIYIYIERERDIERERERAIYNIYIYIYTYTYVCIYIYIERERETLHSEGWSSRSPWGVARKSWNRLPGIMFRHRLHRYFYLQRFLWTKHSLYRKYQNPGVWHHGFAKPNYDINMCRAHPGRHCKHRIVSNCRAYLGKHQISGFISQTDLFISNYIYIHREREI